MSEKIIYNCHNHLFTHENIPNGYFPFLLVPVLRNEALRWVMNGIMKVIIPWTKNDKVHRYASFLNAAYRTDQEGNLRHLMGYYPKGTKFIILPMDMSFMDAGKVNEDIDAQHDELSRLFKDTQYSEILLPFAHIDPRRKNALNRLKNLIENENFKGVKIYPSLGYKVTDDVLMNEIYPYMIERNIPLIAHCSPGIVNSKKLSKAEANALSDPFNFIPVMEKYPELRICLGHFGGIDEWRRYLNETRDEQNPTWLTKILDLITCGKYPNLYTDISYTIFNFYENMPLLKVLLEDEIVMQKVLFGSDYYMVESEKYSEKRLSIDLRAELGEDKFWQIANVNPKKYLYG